jgi:hypothetical protein
MDTADFTVDLVAVDSTAVDSMVAVDMVGNRIEINDPIPNQPRTRAAEYFR